MGDSPVNPLVLIGVGSSFAFSGLFYHLYQEKKKEVKRLKEIPVFRPDQHFVQVLASTPYKRLQYVAVEGTSMFKDSMSSDHEAYWEPCVSGVVQADDQPLASQFVPRCSGVIQKVVTEEQWKYLNYITRTWSSRTVNKKETSNAVPFSLVSPGSYVPGVSVRVQTPLEASGSFLETVHSKVRRAEEGLVDVVLQGLSGEKPAALVESEEMLRVGSSLTGFGEVVLEGGQVVRLQAPQDGRKYILVPSDHKSFMDRHEAAASMWKTLTAVTGTTGAALLAGLVYDFTARRDRRWK